MSAFLSALMPELDYDAIYATPSALKEWVQGGGPHAKTAAFVKADAAPVKRAADRPEQIVKVVPQRQIVPAEMRSENDGAVHSRFGGGIGAPFDGVCDIVIGPLQVFPCEPPTDGSDFLSRLHLISCIPVLYFARMPRDSSSDIKHDRAVFSQIQRETRFRFRNFRNLPAG